MHMSAFCNMIINILCHRCLQIKLYASYHTPHKAFLASWVIYVDKSMHRRQRLRMGTYTLARRKADHPAIGKDREANYSTNKLSWRIVLAALLLPSNSLQHGGSSSLNSKLHYQAYE